MTSSVLYGVGVGPGAPDLLTLRAVQVLKAAPVLALPRSSDLGSSMAWRIIRSVVGESPEQERLFLTFPMSTDPARLRPAWEIALQQIGARLAEGRSVAFATEGDPSLYSTFTYLRREAQRRWPAVRIEIVPGVTSLTAVPAAADLVMADGQQRVAILPAAYGVADLERILAAFDTTIIMKIGSAMPAVVAAVEAQGLLGCAVYVSRAAMPEQRVVRDLRDVRAEHGDCFAMVVVARRDRSGVLAGEVPVTAEGDWTLPPLSAATPEPRP